MKKTLGIVLSLALLMALAPASSSAEARHPNETTVGNPITVESQIKEITRDGDAFVITLHRQKYSFLAWPSTRVRTKDGTRLDVAELRAEDYIRVHGDLQGETVHVTSILLLGRIEHRP